MRNLWRHIQSKSSEVKAQYAFLGASVLTGMIALVWVSTVPSRFSEVTQVDESAQDETGELTELFDEAKTQLGNVIGSDIKTENLDRLGSVEGEGSLSGSENLDFYGDASLGEGTTSGMTGISPESGESVPIETTPVTPRVIRIGTTTAKSL